MYIARSSAGATDAHQEALSRMCRIGGAKFLAMSRAMCYPVKDFAEEIAACSGVDVTADETGVHPSSFCVICRSVINRYSEAKAVHILTAVEVVGTFRCGSFIVGGWVAPSARSLKP